VELPEGGTPQVIPICCIPTETGPLIQDVDPKVFISTAGDSGAEMVIYGLKNPNHFRNTIIALKNGRPMPPAEDGMEDTGATMDMSQHVAAEKPAAAAAASTGGGMFSGLLSSAPGMLGGGEEVALLKSIDSKLSQLVTIANKY